VQVIETRKRMLGAEHPDTLASMANLAYTWKGQLRDKEATALMKECVQLRERVLGLDHRFVSGQSTSAGKLHSQSTSAIDASRAPE
jgi:hypothetical protein